MNTKVRGIVAFRTIYYIPTLVGSVTMATIWLWLLFDRDYGLINRMLLPICALCSGENSAGLGRAGCSAA